MKPSKPGADKLLLRAAERARLRSEYLGSVFARYEAMEEVPEDRLREQLDVRAAAWPRLQLCLTPRADTFLDDVTQIAAAFDLDRAALAAIIRRVDAVEVVRTRQQAGSAGTMLAARTRNPKRSPKPGRSSDD